MIIDWWFITGNNLKFVWFSKIHHGTLQKQIGDVIEVLLSLWQFQAKYVSMSCGLLLNNLSNLKTTKLSLPRFLQHWVLHTPGL